MECDMITRMTSILVAIAFVVSINLNSLADSGTWTNLTGGSWSLAGNWAANISADGTDFTADFSTLNITAARTVTLDGARTIGNLSFSDTGSTYYDWTLATGSAGPLTLAVGSGSPTITVGNLAATISAVLDGTAGLTKAGSGLLTLSGANTYTGDTIINGGTLVVTNSGAINTPLSTLNIANGTNTLAKDGAIIVQTLLATNVVLGGAASSIFNFNGGSLATSNAFNAVAANILVATNLNLNLNGSWTMNGGVHTLMNVATNVTAGNVYIGNGLPNAVVNVNPGSVWSLGNKAVGSVGSTNNMSIYIGNGTAGSNNLMLVNNSLVTNLNLITVGGGVTDVGNRLVITNGGRLFAGNNTTSGGASGMIGRGTGAHANGVYIGGTNSAGVKSTWSLGGMRLNLGATGAKGNWLRVDQGGEIIKTLVFTYGVDSSITVANGGQIVSGASTCYIGRGGSTNNSLTVAGTDAAGTKAKYNSSGQALAIGGNGSIQTGNWVRVVQGGIITNVTSVFVGGSLVSDIRCVNNALSVTNGGQLFSRSASVIGLSTNDNNNVVTVAGNAAFWDLGGSALTNGNHVEAVGNIVNVLDGGILANAGIVVLGGANSKFNLSGNAYSAGINLSVADAQLEFSGGGILHARASGSLISGTGTAAFSGAGGVIDSGAFNVTNEVASTGSGGLTKSGTGTLTLTGANAYTGNTIISNGTLEVVTAGNATLSDDTVVRIGSSGKMKLASGVIEKVYELYLNDERALVGTWGSTSSTAAHKNDIYFTPGSTGVLELRTGRPNGTLIQIF